LVSSPLKGIAMKFNTTTLAELGPPKGQVEAMVFDDDMHGLGLRLRASGARTWVFQYKAGRRSRRITIGDARVVSLAKARKAAADLHARVRLGGDPAGEKAEGRLRAADTMTAALAAYLPHQKTRLKPLSLVQVELHLLKHCRPLHTLQLSQIDRRAVATRMNAITTKSGPVEANRVRASLAAFFAWCIREGMTDSNPAAGATQRPERSRERVLTDAELKVIWTATAGTTDYGAIVRLLMLTGCRLAEIGSLRWSEIDGDRILLPASRTKNGKAHVVPLSAAARAILDARPRRDDRDFVFGRDQNRPFTGWSVSKAAVDERIGADAANWTHHDLRRTAATKMAELGIAPHLIEAVLNHVSGHKHGVAGIYNRATYEPQKKHALDAWADHLIGIVEGRPAAETVVPLRA
jgi:integrase